jgi:hypothetical protein
MKGPLKRPQALEQALESLKKFPVRLEVGCLVYCGRDLRSNRRPGTTIGAGRCGNSGQLLDQQPRDCPLKR